MGLELTVFGEVVELFPQLCSYLLETEKDVGSRGLLLVIEGRRRQSSEGKLLEKPSFEDCKSVYSLVDA